MAGEGSVAEGHKAADGIPPGTALLSGPGKDGEIGHGPSVMEEASFLTNDMMGAPSQAAIMSVVSAEETNEVCGCVLHPEGVCIQDADKGCIRVGLSYLVRTRLPLPQKVS